MLIVRMHRYRDRWLCARLRKFSNKVPKRCNDEVVYVLLVNCLYCEVRCTSSVAKCMNMAATSLANGTRYIAQ